MGCCVSSSSDSAKGNFTECKHAMSTASPPAPPPFCKSDPNSYANTHQCLLRHLNLHWTADFATKVLHGSALLEVEVLEANVCGLVLDSSFLDIQDIRMGGSTLPFTIAQRNPMFGSALIIDLPAGLTRGQTVHIRISYSTTPECTALQWLSPAQTVGGVHPYLFSQCQAIHARSLVPCQDTPSVKFTYEAEIITPPGLRALMSAIPKGHASNSYHFTQNTRIPSYLLALAIGDIHGQKVGPRTTVWSEPAVLKAAAWEFEQTETFIQIGEEFLTPYDWGVYDLLVLPASFPYGGMENPCLTYVTPSLLAGDRSLVDVVAHEISHSWMGNLVTTQNWEHFWLNEGFTVFIERKIMGKMHGELARQFDSIIGLKALQESVDQMKAINHEDFTCLCPRLVNQDPDDAFSSVPYEKGYNFLYYLEQLLGGPTVFEPYLKAHVTKFAHKSIKTDDFKEFLYEYFCEDMQRKLLDAVDWEAWLEKPGMPPVANTFDNTLAKNCESLAARWDQHRTDDSVQFDKAEFEAFSSDQKVMFLEKLMQQQPYSLSLLDEMNVLYDMQAMTNCEVKFRWQMVCLAANYTLIFPSVVAFITTMGRMKYVRPLYRSLAKSGKAGKALAMETFSAHRSFYHPICALMVAKDLGLN